MHEHLKKCFEKTEKRIDWFMELEGEPFTLNTHYFEDYRDKFLTHYTSARARHRNHVLMSAIDDYSPQQVPNLSPSAYSHQEPRGLPKVLAGLAEVHITGVKPEDITKLLPSDGTAPALKIMADVRAYFQGMLVVPRLKVELNLLHLVAYKRFVDNIPQAIDHELIRGVERNILQTLNNGLKLSSENGHKICHDFAQEKLSVASKREELENKLERMLAASEQLLGI
jgi:hypothetical protein